MACNDLKKQGYLVRGCMAVVLSGVLAGSYAARVSADGAVPESPNARQETTEAEKDPFEGVNRVTSGFNRVLRGAVVDPLVDGYQAVTPEPMQNSISNIFSNLSEPVTAVSSLLQGDNENAKTATNRFIINSTIGLGGINDPATGMGMEQRREDMGQAMATNGVKPGPHIVLPLLGPSNLRDATGDILTGFASPLPLAVHAADSGVTYSKYQDDINAVGSTSLDPYVAEREAYEQHREYVVNNGIANDADFPTLADEQGPDLATTPR
ncbi:VacJ family lipoprotein [Thalassospiraceae bacterium LMO-JJ14]|nr:VacJ family lipoprotein [Thalassospiraceae bacterium LMO-JJ14]